MIFYYHGNITDNYFCVQRNLDFSMVLGGIV